MAVIQVQKVPEKVSTPQDAKDLLAELCYCYSQYTYAVARRLPHKTVVLLLKKAHQMEARKYHILTQIAAAPHTEKGHGVKALLDRFEDEARRG
jgi:hypothetical protein